MPRGKMRTEIELRDMSKNIKRRHRPLQRKIEELRIQEKMVDWFMGGDDPFEPETTEGDGALDIQEAEETAEAE